jgi:hypothetical protein
VVALVGALVGYRWNGVRLEARGDQVADEVAELSDRYFRQSEQLVALLAELLSGGSPRSLGDGVLVERALRAATLRYPSIDKLYVLDARDRLVVGVDAERPLGRERIDGTHADPRYAKWRASIQRAPRAFALRGEAGSVRAMELVARISDGAGQMKGVVVAELRFDALRAAVARLEARTAASVALRGDDGGWIYPTTAAAPGTTRWRVSRVAPWQVAAGESSWVLGVLSTVLGGMLSVGAAAMVVAAFARVRGRLGEWQRGGALGIRV